MWPTNTFCCQLSNSLVPVSLRTPGHRLMVVMWCALGLQVEGAIQVAVTVYCSFKETSKPTSKMKPVSATRASHKQHTKYKAWTTGNLSARTSERRMTQVRFYVSTTLVPRQHTSATRPESATVSPSSHTTQFSYVLDKRALLAGRLSYLSALDHYSIQ